MKKEIVILFLIFLLALFLRIYKLGSIPQTFHEDEVLSGYVGRYIIQNGFDLYGNKWPLWYFNKFGDYYIIGPIYLSGLSTYLFGINEFATRFPHAFFGALAVIPMFYFVLEIFKNKKIALLSSLFLAITPWHVVLSRSTTEGIIGSTLFLISLVFLLKSIKNKNISQLLLAFIFSLSTYWVYHPFRFYAPLTFFISLIIFFKVIKSSKKYSFLLIFFTSFFFILSFYISQTPWGKGRFEQTSIFSEITGINIKLNELIGTDKEKGFSFYFFFHNKLILSFREFLNQYFSHFSLNFLNINGWLKSRWSLPEQGLIYFSFLGLILLGFVHLFKTKTNQSDKYIYFFLFSIFLLSPIPSSLTSIESPNPHRSLFMVIFLVLFSSFGFYYLLKSKNFLKILTCLILFGEFFYFIHIYFYHADPKVNLTPYDFQKLLQNDGQKEISLYVIKNLNNYDHIYLPAEAAMSWYYLFYKKDFNPAYSKKFKLDARIDSTGKVFYIENSCPTTIVNPYKIKNKKILIIDKPSCQSDETRWRFLRYIHGVNILLKYKVFEN